MHSTIISLDKTDDFDEMELFEAMGSKWSGIDYINRNDESEQDSVLRHLQSSGVPIKEGCLVVTEELRKKLDSERRERIKFLADAIYNRTCEWAEYDLENVLGDYPYDVYVVVDWEVITLNRFLRTWKPGEYVITETFDYHY